jgi:hypothetical protein
VAIVSLDLIGFPMVLGNRVRAKVPQIPARNIMIGSTHTHSVPDCYGFPDGQAGHTGDLDYMDHVCKQAAEAIEAAWANLLFGLTNDAFGYLLTKVDFNSFSRYDYISRTSLGERTGEIFIERALDLVDKSPAPDRAR